MPEQAITAFVLLGSTARLAIPQITPLLNDPEKASLATTALIGIGPETYPVILQALCQTNSKLRIAVVEGIDWHEDDGGFAVSALISMLSGRNEQVRISAAMALGTIKRKPEFTIPALIQALSDPIPLVQGTAATALGEFGTNAVTALPKLKQLLAQPDHRPVVKMCIEEAIQAITFPIPPPPTKTP